MKQYASHLPRLVALVFCLGLLTGCSVRQWMYNQPKAEVYQASEFFADGRSARPLLPGTVPVGGVQNDQLLQTGRIDGELSEVLPFPVTSDVLNRGQQQYNIYCAPCHGLSGYGDGMVARRGGTPPTNYHTDYLRNKPVGYFFDVMTNGFRNMYPYNQKLSAEDRWTIAAYIRALQLSQNAAPDDMPSEQQQTQGMEQ